MVVSGAFPTCRPALKTVSPGISAVPAGKGFPGESPPVGGFLRITIETENVLGAAPAYKRVRPLCREKVKHQKCARPTWGAVSPQVFAIVPSETVGRWSRAGGVFCPPKTFRAHHRK